MKAIGIVALIIGAAIALFALSMDTSVSSGYGRVHNLGLMAAQRNYLILGAAIAVVGVILLGFASRATSQTAPKPSGAAIGAFDQERDLSSGAYQLYLVRKYQIEKNDTLGKYSVQDTRLFETLDEALITVHQEDEEATRLAAMSSAASNDGDQMRKVLLEAFASAQQAAKPATAVVAKGTIGTQGCNYTLFGDGSVRITLGITLGNVINVKYDSLDEAIDDRGEIKSIAQ